MDENVPLNGAAGTLYLTKLPVFRVSADRFPILVALHLTGGRGACEGSEDRPTTGLSEVRTQTVARRPKVSDPRGAGAAPRRHRTTPGTALVRDSLSWPGLCRGLVSATQRHPKSAPLPPVDGSPRRREHPSEQPVQGPRALVEDPPRERIAPPGRATRPGGAIVNLAHWPGLRRRAAGREEPTVAPLASRPDVADRGGK